MLSTPMSPWMLVISLVDHLLYWWRVSPSVTRDFKQSILGGGGMQPRSRFPLLLYNLAFFQISTKIHTGGRAHPSGSWLPSA